MSNLGVEYFSELGRTDNWALITLWGLRSSYKKQNLSLVYLVDTKKSPIQFQKKSFWFDQNLHMIKNTLNNFVVGLSYLGRLEAPHYVSYPFKDLTNSFLQD